MNSCWAMEGADRPAIAIPVATTDEMRVFLIIIASRVLWFRQVRSWPGFLPDEKVAVSGMSDDASRRRSPVFLQQQIAGIAGALLIPNGKGKPI